MSHAATRCVDYTLFHRLQYFVALLQLVKVKGSRDVKKGAKGGRSLSTHLYASKRPGRKRVLVLQTKYCGLEVEVERPA